MTSGLHHHVEHPLETLVSGVRELVASYGDGAAWTMTPKQLEAALVGLAEAQKSLDSVRLRMLREADRHEVGSWRGSADTASWWAGVTRLTRPAARREVKLAARLDDSAHEATSDAMAAGVVAIDQAGVILDAVDDLPKELVDAALRRTAETHLVELAEKHDAKELRILGRRIVEMIAPEVGEEVERQILERQEQQAQAAASFSMRPNGEGSMVGRFKIPLLAGEILSKHLNAIAAPRHRAATGPEKASASVVARPIRLGEAFTEYIETRAASGTPKAGGIAATIAVTMTLENLLGKSEKGAVLDTGETISAATARRLACEAGIIPAVLGGASQVLDVGRKSRYHREPQRTALMLQHKGCAAEGCDWPPGMCHAHHLIPWSKGGRTSVKDGTLLCPRHHTLAHDARYQMKTGKNGKVTFSRLR